MGMLISQSDPPVGKKARKSKRRYRGLRTTLLNKTQCNRENSSEYRTKRKKRTIRLERKMGGKEIRRYEAEILNYDL